MNVEARTMKIEDIKAQMEDEEKRVDDEKLKEEEARAKRIEKEDELRKFIHSFIGLLKVNYKWELYDGTEFLYIKKRRINTVDVSVEFLIEYSCEIPSKRFQEQELVNAFMSEGSTDFLLILLKRMLVGPNTKLSLVG